VATVLAGALLDAWESGLHASAPRRALALLGAACPDTVPEALALLPLGQRDGRLLALREQLFGPQVVCRAACPQCDEELELAFGSGEMPMPPQATQTQLEASVGEYRLALRLPNSLDLIALTGYVGADPPGRFLCRRCLIAAHQGDEPRALEELPHPVVEAAIEQLGRADPQADLRVALCCPACGHSWQAPFDIVSFFWCELDAWARRTLHEIHCLARAYGWREAEILALSPRRRQLYLEQIGL
jgi:hypothetical protein